MTTSQLVKALEDVQRMYGDIPARIDLGMETVHKAFDIDSVMCALFPNQVVQHALVIFTGWKSMERSPDHRRMTPISALARELTGWFNLVGDLPVRVDLGFMRDGLCYDTENVNIGHFPNENNMTALVIYTKSSLPKVNVSAN